MSNNNSILSLQHSSSQYSNNSFKDGKTLKSLWLSIPAICHLSCPYCFASTNNPDKRIEKISFESYEKIIREFASLGGEFIGIPGDGEPFHDLNWELTKFIITLCSELKIKLALFTTGDLIFFKPNGNESQVDYGKIDFIGDKDVVLLIKYNHSNEDIQNNLVGNKNPNYARLREKAIEILIDKYHFNDGKRRLGLVTSIMKENAEKLEPNGKLEIINIFERSQRDNLIFDCDTILELGRGKSFSTSEKRVLPQVDLEKVFKKLSEAGAVGLNQGGTYVGNTCCDRILHHLYIKANGDVFPCIGCSREDLCDKMQLGNIEYETIKELWNKPLRRRLAENRYETLVGVCANCENFQTEKCYSCLGRCVLDEDSGTPINDDGLITTIGCIHHKPSTTTWLANLVDYVRTILSYPNTTKNLEEKGLEFLWRPNKNIAYTLCQLNAVQRKQEIINIIEHTGNPHDDLSYEPYNKIINSKVADFSQKKHFRYSELLFPMNKVWDFAKDPEEHFKPKESFLDILPQKEKVIETISQSFLSNIFLSSFKILFEKYDYSANNIAYCNFMFFDNIKEKYFYRSIVKDTLTNNTAIETLKVKSLIISRWYEDIIIDEKPENFWKNYCYNLSAAFRHELYGDYELKLGHSDESFEAELNLRTIDLTDIIELPILHEKVEKFKNYCDSKDFEVKFDQVKGFINNRIFTELDPNDREKLKNLYDAINSNSFYCQANSYSDESQEVALLLNNIKKIIEKLLVKREKLNQDTGVILKLQKVFNKVRDRGDGWKFINYFIYLGIMHETLGINYYYLLHSTNFTTINPYQKELIADSDISGIIKSSGLLICTKNPINQHFRAELKLFISSIFAPFDEFYFNLRVQDIKLYDEVQWYQHSLDNIYRDVLAELSEFDYLIKKNTDEKLKEVTKVLKANFKVYDISRRGISRKYESIENYIESNDLWSMLELVVTSIRREHFNVFPKEFSFSFQDKTAREKLLIFTIIWNLLHNAYKFRNSKEVIVRFDSSQSILSISNNESMSEKHLNYINGFTNKYPSERKYGGLAIVKSLSEILKLSIKVSANQSNTTIIIAF